MEGHFIEQILSFDEQTPIAILDGLE